MKDIISHLLFVVTICYVLTASLDIKKENLFQLGFEPGSPDLLVRHSYQLSHWDSGIRVEDIWHIYP